MTISTSAASLAAQAGRAYETLIARDPAHRLSPATERLIEAYAETVLGSGRFAPWLKIFTAVRGDFLPGWLPDNFLARHVLPVVQGAAGRRLAADRALARRVLGTPLLADLACRVNGSWIDPFGRPIAPEALEDRLYRRTGVVLLRREGGRGTLPLPRDCFARETRAPGDLVLQRRVAQDPALEALVPGALAILRVVTLKPAGEPARPAGSLLRLARAGEGLPDPAREITLPLTGCGRVSGPGLAPDWTRLAAHPDSGRRFEGLDLPGHAAAVAACLGLHDGLPQIVMAGWNLALGPKGRVHLLDWEPEAPATARLQALSGPVLDGMGWEELWRGNDPAAEPEPAARVPLSLVPPVAPVPAPVAAPVTAAVAEIAAPPVRPRRPILDLVTGRRRQA